MGSAELALWARAHSLSRQDVRFALWQKRSLVKTSAMRQTLHLLPASEYHLYIAALKQSRMEALLRIMARIDVGSKEMAAMTAALMKILGDDPVPQGELAEQVKPHISRKLQASMKLFWNNWPIFRPGIIEGLICYGPNQGRETTFVRVERWLGERKTISETDAKQFLLQHYLRAYGPATLRDFSRWSGIPMKEAKPIWDSLQRELIEISIEGTKASLLRDDGPELEETPPSRGMVRLLPAFDPYMLAHAEKGHLVHERHYKRVYRNQGWLSPVILLDGRVVGVWSAKRSGKRVSLETEFFQKIPRTALAEVEREFEKLVRFTTTKDSMEATNFQ